MTQFIQVTGKLGQTDDRGTEGRRYLLSLSEAAAQLTRRGQLLALRAGRWLLEIKPNETLPTVLSPFGLTIEDVLVEWVDNHGAVSALPS